MATADPRATPAVAEGDTNYIDALALEIQRLADPNPSEDWFPLYRIYAVLALAKGTATTMTDVHDAWSAFMAGLDPGHRSLIPFADLRAAVQDSDRPFMEAIHLAARPAPAAIPAADKELHRLLLVAERGLEAAVDFWGVQDDVPTEAEVRRASHEGLAAIREALNDVANRRPTPATASDDGGEDEMRQSALDQWLAAHDDHCTSMEDCASFGTARTCYWPKPLPLVRAATREASRGEGRA